MADKAEIKQRIEFRKAALKSAREAYLGIMSGSVQSYKIGNREVTKHNISVLASEIERLEKDLDSLENLSSGKKPRKAFGIIPRDI